jgi:hypothetical protein
MKIYKQPVLHSLAVLLMSSGVANAAADSEQAVQACAAEIETFLEAQRQVDDLNLNLDQSGIDNLVPLNRVNVFELDAFDPDSGNVIGRFTCTVNRRAKVTMLAPLPLSERDAKFRGRG